MTIKIPYGKQFLFKKDIVAVNKVLNSNTLTQGNIEKKFENNISKYVNSKHAILFNSASSGLLAACLALDLTKNDEVWTSPISYVASANCAIHCNAKLKFIDIDSETFNISYEKLSENLFQRKKLNKKLPKILIVVHLAGNPCDMLEIYKLSRKYNFKIIEDASHAFGSVYKKNKIGSCNYSDISIFSFHPVKSITTAEGGAATTNNKKLYQKLQMIKVNGITKDKNKFTNILNKKIPQFYYEQQLLGYNFKMNELQAALGLSQLTSINKFITKRNKIAKKYIFELNNLNISFQKITNDSKCAYHLFIIQVEKKYHKKLFNYFYKNSINVNLHYIPIYKHPFYKKIGYKNIYLKNAENYYTSAISIPIFYDLNEKTQDYVISKIKKFYL